MEAEGLAIVIRGRWNWLVYGFREILNPDGNVRFHGRNISIMRVDDGIANRPIPHCVTVPLGREPSGIERHRHEITCAISEPGALALGFLSENKRGKIVMLTSATVTSFTEICTRHAPFVSTRTTPDMMLIYRVSITTPDMWLIYCDWNKAWHLELPRFCRCGSNLWYSDAHKAYSLHYI